MRLFLPLTIGLLVALSVGCLPSATLSPTWTTYTSPDGKFTANFPKEPLRVETQTPAGKPSIRIFASFDNEQLNYEIQHVEGAEPAQAVQLLAMAPAATVKSKNGTLLDDRAVTLGEWQGRAFSFSAVENNVPTRHHVRVFIVGTRVYVLSVFGKQELVNDGDADKFLKSFAVRSGM